MQADSFKLLNSTPPTFSLAEAEHIAAHHFGVKAKANPLVSDKDQNFRMDLSNGARFTLKIANQAEQQSAVDFQNSALVHIARQDTSIPVPRVIPDRDGQPFVTINDRGSVNIVRLLSWLDGVALNEGSQEPELAGAMGEMLARLGLALKSFDHPGSNPVLSWDMKRAANLRELLPYSAESEAFKLIIDALDRFDRHVIPRLKTLRTQVIHNDLNPGNVLLNKSKPECISGIIDFGDMVSSPLIIDLAVAATYQLSNGDDPLAGALPMIAAYHRVCKLQQQEMHLLTDLIRTRLITSLLINAYRVSLFPENREYLMISFAAAQASLISLNHLDADHALERIARVCGSATDSSP